jgi:hypothetical protein
LKKRDKGVRWQYVGPEDELALKNVPVYSGGSPVGVVKKGESFTEARFQKWIQLDEGWVCVEETRGVYCQNLKGEEWMVMDTTVDVFSSPGVVAKNKLCSLSQKQTFEKIGYCYFVSPEADPKKPLLKGWIPTYVFNCLYDNPFEITHCENVTALMARTRLETTLTALNNPITFVAGEAGLQEKSTEALRVIAAVLKDFPQIQLRVIISGPDKSEAAQRLDLNRAGAVADWLASAGKIEARRVTPVSEANKSLRATVTRFHFVE